MSSIPPLPIFRELGPGRIETGADAADVTADATVAPKRTNRARLYLLVGAGVAAASLFTFRAMRTGTETTDQATVGARVTTIAAEGEGIVADVLVDDHALVEKGAPLLRLDTAALDARVASARAALASAEAMLDASRQRGSVVGRQVANGSIVARADEAAARGKQRGFEAEAARAQAAVDSAVVVTDLANKELERVRTLHESE